MCWHPCIYIYTSMYIYVHIRLLWSTFHDQHGDCAQTSPLQRVPDVASNPGMPSPDLGQLVCPAQLPWPGQNLHPENLPMEHEARVPLARGQAPQAMPWWMGWLENSGSHQLADVTF